MKSVLQAKRDTHRARNLLWVATGMVVILFLFILVGERIGREALTWGNGFYPLAVAFGLALFVAVGFLGAIQVRKNIVRLQEQYHAAQKMAEDADRRLKTVFRLSQKFVEASDEHEVIEEMLQVSADLAGASGATFVPLDELGQPLTAVKHGDFPAPVINSWMEYLASPTVRDQCGTCQNQGTLVHTCPLLPSPFSDAVRLYCLPLRRGEREFGVLNVYLPDGVEITGETQDFLRAILDETALALEGVRLRQREMAALRQLQAVQRRTELRGLLSHFLENVRDTLKADLAYLEVYANDPGQSNISLSLGEAPEGSAAFIEAVIQRIVSCDEVVSIKAGEIAGPHPDLFQHTLAVRLLPQEGQPVGAILAANLRAQSFNKRQQVLLQAVASQVAQVLENAQVMADLEYQTLMAERTRLAREIHDGLAQTIGFLKLQTAQMQNYLSQGDYGKLADSLKDAHKVLTEAYLDARQAIDGLRASPHEYGLSAWLEQAADEFQETSGLQVELAGFHCADGLAPEVQAQLIRILQEALSNVRKHAKANHVRVSCRQDRGDLLLEVRDDGIGFSSQDVPESSRYGLQGMRERTELIGAEFQVISKPLEGTAVRVRLPLVIRESIL